MKTLLVDPARCVQCCNCQISCKDEHCDNDWSPIAAPQGPSQFWIQIREHESATGARVKMERTPVMCQQCANASCMTVCPVGAIYRRDDGIVIIDPTKCTGCGACNDACPYGAIYANDKLGISQKCTMCAHLLDDGWKQPRCVTSCPSDALSWVDTDDLTEENLYAPLEQLKAETGNDPQVVYVNLPKPFVGGEVCSPAGDASIDGVKVTATHQVTGATFSDVTDNYGDFDVTGLNPGFYTLSFEKDGFILKVIKNLDLREALNVGEVRVYVTSK
ncbi:MAG: 4Fe-4S dicluster domain-containing protein [Coriobacteriia bacterium]|nr:4Fe-4S dicluster domain-containing protein [Coriobacteriia bacterium]